MDDVIDEKLSDPEYLKTPEALHRVDELIDQLISGYTYDRDLWLDGQNAGFAWAPLRRPEENLDDEHWGLRETFVDVEYPELGKTFRQGRAKWTAPGLPWRTGPRAPLLGEHTAEVLAEPDRAASAEPVIKKPADRPISKRGKPFASRRRPRRRLRLDPGERGCRAVLDRPGRRGDQGRAHHQAGHDARRQVGAPRWPARRTGPRHRADQSMPMTHQPQPQWQLHGDQLRQARPQPQPEARPGQGDSDRAAAHRRHRRRGILPGHHGPDGLRLGGHAQDQPAPGVRAAIGDGTDRQVRADAQLRADSPGVLRDQRDVRACPSRIRPPASATPTSTGSVPTSWPPP